MSTKQGSAVAFGLFHRILLSFLIAIIPFLVIGSIFVANGEKTLKEEIMNSLHMRMHFYLNEFSRELEHIINLKREFTFDKQIQEYSVMLSIMSEYKRHVELIAIQRKMQTLKSSSSYIKDVRIHIVTDHKTISPERIKFNVQFEKQEYLDMVNDREFPILFWKGSLMLVEQYPFTVFSDDLPLYWIEIELDRDKIKSILESLLGTNEGGAVLHDSHGEWAVFVSLNEPEFTEERINDLLTDGFMGGDVHDFLAVELSTDLGLTLRTYLNEDQILQPLAVYKTWFRVLVATALIVIVLFSYWLYMFILKPLHQLIRAFRRVKSGLFDTSLRRKHKDEIHFLYQQFNHMVQMIQSLIEDVYEQSIRSQRAELRHLQAQINPHFLYNTYYRLHRLAQDEDTENIKHYSRLLGDYMKYITRNAYDVVTLQVECNHAKTYADIQKMRFGDKITIDWEETPDLLEMIMVPRLIIQPIVENAFNHGLEELEGGGYLRFRTVARDRDVAIYIEDNGDSLTDQELVNQQERLHSSIEDIETTGLLNVHRRIQLKFGKSYGLRLSRCLFGGLCVEIVLPTLERGSNDVSLINR